MSHVLRIAAVLVPFFSAAGCRRVHTPVATAIATATPPAPKPSDFRTADADEGFLGMIIAPETVDVTSQLEGRLTSIQVRAGDHVVEGAILAKLDTRSAQHELSIAAAELAAAITERDRSKLELAQSEEQLARRQSVVELPSGTVRTVSDEELSASRYTQKIAAVKVAAAAANVSSKAAHLAQLRQLLAEGAVRAPFDGTVATRYADVGSLIHKGAPIVRLIESGELRVRFAIPEEQADALANGDRVRIVAGELTLPGIVEKINPEIDAAARMVFAEASIAVPVAERSRVRSGQMARVHAPSRAEHATATLEEAHVVRAQ
jgi:RND family efflux transporter MFP subunit